MRKAQKKNTKKPTANMPAHPHSQSSVPVVEEKETKQIQEYVQRFKELAPCIWQDAQREFTQISASPAAAENQTLLSGLQKLLEYFPSSVGQKDSKIALPTLPLPHVTVEMLIEACFQIYVAANQVFQLSITKTFSTHAEQLARYTHQWLKVFIIMVDFAQALFNTTCLDECQVQLGKIESYSEESKHAIAESLMKNSQSEKDHYHLIVVHMHQLKADLLYHYLMVPNDSPAILYNEIKENLALAETYCPNISDSRNRDLLKKQIARSKTRYEKLLAHHKQKTEDKNIEQKETLTRLQKSSEDFKKENDRMQPELQKLQDTNSRLVQQEKEKDEALKKQISANGRLISESKTAKARQDDSLLRLARAQDEKVALEASNAKLTKENSDLKATVEELKKQLADVQAQFGGMSTQNKQLLKEFQKSEEKNRDLNALYAVTISNLNSRTVQLEKALQDQSQKERIKTTVTINVQQNQIERLQDKTKKNEETILDQAAEIKDLRKSLSIVQSAEAPQFMPADNTIQENAMSYTTLTEAPVMTHPGGDSQNSNILIAESKTHLLQLPDGSFATVLTTEQLNPGLTPAPIYYSGDCIPIYAPADQAIIITPPMQSQQHQSRQPLLSLTSSPSTGVPVSYHTHELPPRPITQASSEEYGQPAPPPNAPYQINHSPRLIANNRSKIGGTRKPTPPSQNPAKSTFS